MDPDEEEAPPLLVDVEAKDDEPKEEPNIRVPITIVTGKSCLSVTDCFLLTGQRVPWSWEDYVDELHLE